jgi:hypothetical protein
MEVRAVRHAPAALAHGKTRYPLYRRLGGTQGRSGRVRKTSSPLGFDPQTVRSLAGRYTNWASPAYIIIIIIIIIIIRLSRNVANKLPINAA